MRAYAITLLGSTLAVAACGGGDLLLPTSTTPAQLRLVSGDLQQAQTGTTLPDPLVVEALDAGGRPVVGSRILFRLEVDRAGAKVNPDTAQTDESGRATAEVRLGEPGGHPVEAVVVDAPTGLRVRFLLTAIAPAPAPPPPDGGDDDDGDGGNGGNGGGGGGGGGGGDGGGDDGDDDGGVDEGGGDDDDGKGGKGKGKGKGGRD
jgi:hypothetical protein